MQSHYITKRDLAEMFRISNTLINSLMKKGLPYVKLGRSVRFNPAEVTAYLTQMKRKPNV